MSLTCQVQKAVWKLLSSTTLKAIKAPLWWMWEMSLTSAVQPSCAANIGSYKISQKMKLLAVLASPMSHTVAFSLTWAPELYLTLTEFCFVNSSAINLAPFALWNHIHEFSSDKVGMFLCWDKRGCSHFKNNFHPPNILRKAFYILFIFLFWCRQTSHFIYFSCFNVLIFLPLPVNWQYCKDMINCNKLNYTNNDIRLGMAKMEELYKKIGVGQKEREKSRNTLPIKTRSRIQKLF